MSDNLSILDSYDKRNRKCGIACFVPGVERTHQQVEQTLVYRHSFPAVKRHRIIIINRRPSRIDVIDENPFIFSSFGYDRKRQLAERTALSSVIQNSGPVLFNKYGRLFQ